jgi:hypothetical protein
MYYLYIYIYTYGCEAGEAGTGPVGEGMVALKQRRDIHATAIQQRVGPT